MATFLHLAAFVLAAVLVVTGSSLVTMGLRGGDRGRPDDPAHSELWFERITGITVIEAGRFALTPDWRMDLLTLGMVVYPAGHEHDPRLVARGTDPSHVHLVIDSRDDDLPENLLHALSRLADQIPTPLRGRLRVLVRSSLSAEAVSILRRAVPAPVVLVDDADVAPAQPVPVSPPAAPPDSPPDSLPDSPPDSPPESAPVSPPVPTPVSARDAASTWTFQRAHPLTSPSMALPAERSAPGAVIPAVPYMIEDDETADSDGDVAATAPGRRTPMVRPTLATAASSPSAPIVEPTGGTSPARAPGPATQLVVGPDGRMLFF